MELGIAKTMIDELGLSLTGLKSRKKGEDPPDCEAKLPSGGRVAIEVTEIVDQDAVHQAAKSGSGLNWCQWTESSLVSALTEAIRSKDEKRLKGTPYEEYWVFLHTDEPTLTDSLVEDTIARMHSVETRQIDQTYLMLSYVPWLAKCPVFPIPVRK